jgi:rubrerythrin
LENVFYKQALSKFKQEDFTKAGFKLDFLPNLEFLAEDEQSHVQSLSKAIQQAGQSPVAACEYNFPYTDV